MAEEKKKSGTKKAAKPADKAALKKKLGDLKQQRGEAIASKDKGKIARVRDRYRSTTRALRKLAPPKGKKVKAE